MMYKQSLDMIALGVLLKDPQIPDYHLMVGSAECLDGLPVLINAVQMVPKAINDNMKKVADLEDDQLQYMLENNQLEINDYAGNAAIIGSMIGGVR